MAVDGDEIVGTIGYAEMPAPETAELKHFVIIPKYRRGGLGKR